jgi:hypothetical protein
MPAGPAEAGAGRPLAPLPPAFLDRLRGLEELLVSSRDRSGRGTVPMWFAVVPPGYVYLLTQPFSLKAQRWLDDPWVRLQVPGDRVQQEGLVAEVGWEEASQHGELLTERFAMAGAATEEALRWMLQEGSRRLVKVGLAASPDSQAPVLVEGEDRG